MATEAFPYPSQPWSDGQTAYQDNADGTRTVATYNQSINTWRIQQVGNDLGDYFLVPNDINMGDGTKLTAKIAALSELDSAILAVNTSIAALPTQVDVDAVNDSIDAKFDAFRSAVEGANDFTSLRTRLLAVLPE